MDESIIGKKCSCCPSLLAVYPSYYIIQGGHYDPKVPLNTGGLGLLRRSRSLGEGDGLPRTKCQTCGETYTTFWVQNDPNWREHIQWVAISTETGKIMEQMPPEFYVETKTDSGTDHGSARE